MGQALSKASKSLQSNLKSGGLVDCKVVELASSVRTADDAARDIGCTIAQVVKALIFKTEITGRPVLVFASGLNRVSEKTLELLVGEKVVKAEGSFTKEVTGFSVGGIPPIGHKQKIELVFIDEGLMKLSMVWVPAGHTHAVFAIAPKSLLAVTLGKAASVK